MRKLSSFTFISLDGYYKDAENGISWHSHGDEEESRFAAEGAQSDSTLVFGRVTYDMMAAWWPTPMAKNAMPDVAKGMNASKKIVFSRSMDKAAWENTEVISGDIVAEIHKRKEEPGNNMTILGSGSIVSLFAAHNLIDEYQLMIDPLLLGGGTPLFNSMPHPVALELIHSRIFSSGRALLTYRPANQ